MNKILELKELQDKALQLGFSLTDLGHIQDLGISLDKIERQLGFFKNGIRKTELVSTATINNGIAYLNDKEFETKALYFDANKSKLKLLKFVPASGAATRMFKFLNVFLKEFQIGNETINAYINRKKDTDLAIFIVGMDKFPFFQEVYAKLKEEFIDFDNFNRDYKNYYFIKFLLWPEYFDFANKPKGILPFHLYLKNIATPIEEHLYECGYYSSVNGFSNLHFTVSESHKPKFEEIVRKIKPAVEKETQTKIEVSYSFQSKSTDTIAVDMDNNPVRDLNQNIVFRPGGHGALIENLNNLDADVIFVKNIDNVIMHNNEKIALYKKALAGILLEIQEKVFGYLHKMDSNNVKEDDITEVLNFLKNKISLNVFPEMQSLDLNEKIISVKEILNRPIRVCGMVKDENETGGGPFWVVDENDKVSLQIVETAQIDLKNSSQKYIFKQSTHFNPVDLVCGIKNYKGEKYDLVQFVDHNSGFVVEKNLAGKAIKGYELPGLWNGGMAFWLSFFVQVPLMTFNPVKTVNDLLKPAHQRD